MKNAQLFIVGYLPIVAVFSYRYCDAFSPDEAGLGRTEKVYAYGAHRLVFETEVENRSNRQQEISIYGYAAIRNTKRIAAEKTDRDLVCVHTGKVYIGMYTSVGGEMYLVNDSPTDFADSKEELAEELQSVKTVDLRAEAADYWRRWIQEVERTSGLQTEEPDGR